MKRLLIKLQDQAFRNVNFKEFPSFVERNTKFLNNLKVDWDTSIRCGAMGCILETHDPEWVIKITMDEHEAALFETVRDENIKSGFVKVKDIFHEDRKLFIIVKQKITPLDDLSSMIDYDSITAQYVNFMHVYYQETNDVKQNRKSISAAITTIRKSTFRDVVDIFISLRKLAYAGYKLMDIDLDNIGYAEGNQLVIFDAQIESIK